MVQSSVNHGMGQSTTVHALDAHGHAHTRDHALAALLLREHADEVVVAPAAGHRPDVGAREHGLVDDPLCGCDNVAVTQQIRTGIGICTPVG